MANTPSPKTTASTTPTVRPIAARPTNAKSRPAPVRRATTTPAITTIATTHNPDHQLAKLDSKITEKNAPTASSCTVARADAHKTERSRPKRCHHDTPITITINTSEIAACQISTSVRKGQPLGCWTSVARRWWVRGSPTAAIDTWYASVVTPACCSTHI